MAYSNLLAMEVLTYNRPQVVEDVLKSCAEHYKRCGVEIYYFDSSTNDETKKVIEEFNAKGFDNIIHVPVKGGAPPHIKRTMIYEGKGLLRKYRYVWLTKDRAWVEESALKEILKVAEEEYDAILIATRPGDKTYIDSAEELFSRWAPISTSMNTVLLNTETILKDYKVPECVIKFPRWFCDFGHYYTLFDGLSRIENPRISRIEMDNRIIMSPLGESTWTHEAFVVWEDSWIVVNDMLPSIYAPYKDYIIKKVAELPWILAERNRLIELYEKGALKPEMLPHILENWERISDIPKEVVIAIANGEYDIRYDLSQISDRNQLTKLLVEMAGYIKNGKMAVSQIPFEDIIAATKIELAQDEDKPRRNIRLGAVESIFKEFNSDTLTPERTVELIQQILGYII